jgi:hypothetical protein
MMISLGSSSAHRPAICESREQITGHSYNFHNANLGEFRRLDVTWIERSALVAVWRGIT